MPLLLIPYPQFDPVLVHLGPLDIRWYALAYITGILGGWLYARAIIGMDIRGLTVREVWIEAASEIASEYYASVIFDRSAKAPLVMLSTKGGMDIEQVADEDPEAIARLHVDPLVGFQDFHGRRLAFVAGAGRPSAGTKRMYFTRYFADSALSEEWASGSLGPFNALEHQALTFPYVRPALDSLPFIQANRRIFFLETWLAAFLRGQTGDSALRVVRRYLDEHPRLPLDLRRKVLQHMDELERTVRIRGRARHPERSEG